MFDIGFSEIALVAVVALLVLGPERLPRAARTAGALVRRARSSWNNVRGEIERELASEDIRKSIAEAKAAMSDAKAAMTDAAQNLDPRSDVEAAAKSIRDEISSEPAEKSGSDVPSDER